MNTDILKNSASNNREINTDSLKIYGNCLEFRTPQSNSVTYHWFP